MYGFAQDAVDRVIALFVEAAPQVSAAELFREFLRQGHYTAVGQSRALSKVDRPLPVLSNQVYARPVLTLLFRQRCPKLRPPQRRFVRKYMRAKR